MPRNNFMLSKEARKSILLAGGSGVTPMKSMMHVLVSAKQEYESRLLVRLHPRWLLLMEFKNRT